jgi:hypothetical protein
MLVGSKTSVTLGLVAGSGTKSIVIIIDTYILFN